MSTTIVHKKSAISGRIPNTGQMNFGEIAINTVDGKVYTRVDDGTDRVIDLVSRAVFQSSTEPLNPEEGQLWLDTDLDRLYVYSGGEWISTTGTAATLTVSATAPDENVTTQGDMWFDNNTTGELFIYVDGNWITTAGPTGIQLDDLEVVQNDPAGEGSLTFDDTTGTFTYTPPEISGAGGGVDLTAFSVTTTAAGSNALTYNNTTGVFTFTPQDLSSYATTSYVDTATQNMATTGYVDSAVAGLATESYVDNAVAAIDAITPTFPTDDYGDLTLDYPPLGVESGVNTTYDCSTTPLEFTIVDHGTL